MQVARFLLQIALGIALTYAVQRWDRGRLSEEQRARAWNAATWGAALYALGPLSMVPWGWVTRRGDGWRGALRGVVGMLGGVLVGLLIALTLRGIDLGFAWALGLPIDLEGEMFGR